MNRAHSHQNYSELNLVMKDQDGVDTLDMEKALFGL